RFLLNPVGNYGEMSARIDLNDVFGPAPLRPQTSAPVSKALSPTSVRVGDGSVTLFANTLSTNKIELTLDKTFRVTSAKKNGESVLLLSDGRIPRAPDRPVIFPNEITVPSAAGSIKLILGGSLYHYKDKSGNDQQMDVSVAVNPATGDVFLGPSDCRLAVF